MLKTINVLIRLIAAVHLTLVTCFHVQGQVPPELMPLGNRMGGKAKYLTIWANAASASYYWLALINDLISGFKDDKDQLLKRIKDFIFFSAIFPLTTVVSLMFWSLYAVNRELIFPKKLEAFLPGWLNHSLHTAIFVYAVLELLTSYHKPSSKRSHMIAVAAVFGSYAIWYHIIYFVTGLWVYPFLSHLSWFGRTFLAAFTGLIAFASLFLGLYGNDVIWRNRVQECRKSKRK